MKPYILLSVTLLAVSLVGCATQSPQELSDNKAVVLRTEAELWSKGNLAVADELYSPDFVCHFIVGPEWRGLEGIKGAVRSHRISFPDWHERVDDIVAEGDRVVIRFTSTGTQLGEFQGIAPTGRKVSIQEVAIFRVVDSKIVEQWGMPDIQGLMQQLGATNSQRRGKISEHATLAEALDAWLCVDTDGLPVGDWPAMAIWKDGKWTAKYRSGRPYE